MRMRMQKIAKYFPCESLGFATILLLVFFLSIVYISPGFAEVKKEGDLDSIKVTLLTEEITLHEAFQLLIVKTKLQIIYNDALIKNYTVKCSFKNVALRKVIKTLLKNSGLTFKVMKDGQLVILKQNPDKKHILQGYVRDSFSKNVLPYANVTIKNSKIGTSSKANTFPIIGRIWFCFTKRLRSLHIVVISCGCFSK